MDFDELQEKPDFGYDDQLEVIDDRITLLNDQADSARERIQSASRRLTILDAYGNSLDKEREHPIAIEQGLDSYRTEREKVFADHKSAQVELRATEKQLKDVRSQRSELAKLEAKAVKQWNRKLEKERRAAVKKQQRQRGKRRDKERERERIKKERAAFWPKFHYAVTVTLDASAYTPVSSRRSSISSEADLQLLKEKDPALQQDAAAAAGTEGGENPSSSSSAKCDLVISYVTSSAFWAPSYDLQLSTTSNTATLSFEAKLTNATSETWRNTKIILSTSQTSFSGLEDALPSLVPWHVKLGNKSHGVYASDALNSREERSEQVTWEVQRYKQQTIQKPRGELFGLWAENDNNLATATQARQAADAAKNKVQMMQMAQIEHAERDLRNNYVSGGGSNAFSAPRLQVSRAPPAPLVKKAKAAANSSFAMASSFAPAVSESVRTRGGPVDLFGAPPPGSRGGGGGGGDSSGDEGGDDETMLEPAPELDFEDSAMEETGLTTTYDLPGLRTLTPRSRASKQRIARINFSNVVFNHTVVAKYRPVAFLKAKLRNGSKLTLLRGPAGLTLDGSFMGRTRIPRCSAGDSFLLSLGVDPAIRVSYPQPEVRRSTTGLFSKEDSSIYTRAVTLTNTKAAAGKAASIYVFDQVPISEDERLRVAIHAPRGLVSGGAAVNSGVPGRDGPDNKDWGKATALLRKENEISWEVSLKAGKSVKLALEYEVAAPAGEHVIQC